VSTGGKVSKGAGKVWKFVIGGILAVFGGIASICGCSKKKDDNSQSQIRQESYDEENERQENLRFLHAVYRPEDTAPRSVIVLGYSPLNLAEANGNSNDSSKPEDNVQPLMNQPPPSYQESTAQTQSQIRDAKSQDQLPPPSYQNC
jgi:hypothetical protein